MTTEPPTGDQAEQAPPTNEPPRLEPWGEPGPAVARDARRETPADYDGRFAEIVALMHNRFIIGGLGLVAVLLVLAVVLVALGGGGDEGTVSAVNQNTPVSDRTVVPLDDGLPGRVAASASMRNGPDASYAILGTIPKNAVVAVVGRNEDGSWFQIVYPPGSQLRGWIDAELVDIEGDVESLPIGGAGVGPNVDVPTSEYVPPVEVPTEIIDVPTDEEATPTEEEDEPTSTPEKEDTPALPTETPVIETPVP